jgi:hypothetical protein
MCVKQFQSFAPEWFSPPTAPTLRPLKFDGSGEASEESRRLSARQAERYDGTFNLCRFCRRFSKFFPITCRGQGIVVHSSGRYSQRFEKRLQDDGATDTATTNFDDVHIIIYNASGAKR